MVTGAAAHELPKLPWADDALAPHISPRTIGFHYGKHHAGYVRKLNAALEGTDAAGLPLEKLIALGAEGGDYAKYFNNAAQIWNHTFYWNSMRPGGGGAPSGRMADLIGASFGGWDEFRAAFAKAAGGQFGSGWAWLVAEGDKLAITATGNAGTPIAHGGKPLLTCDVWEHAYYLDYQNARGDYTGAFLDHLINWEFAEANLG
jgi:Fe-Mn family superoxide dismutase